MTTFLNTNLLPMSIILAWALCAAFFAAYAVSVAREITYVTLADGRKTERRIPLAFRLLLPLVPNLRAFVARPAFASSRAAADRMIVSAASFARPTTWTLNVSGNAGDANYVIRVTETAVLLDVISSGTVIIVR